MRSARVASVGLVITMVAVPLWILDAIEIDLRSGAKGNSRSYLLTAVVLLGITVALQRLLRSHRNSWASSALISGVIVLLVLLWSAGW